MVFSLNAFRMPTWLYKLGNFFKETGMELVGRTAGSAKAAENYLLKAQEQAGKNKPLELDPLVDFNAEVAKASEALKDLAAAATKAAEGSTEEAEASGDVTEAKTVEAGASEEAANADATEAQASTEAANADATEVTSSSGAATKDFAGVMSSKTAKGSMAAGAGIMTGLMGFATNSNGIFDTNMSAFLGNTASSNAKSFKEYKEASQDVGKWGGSAITGGIL